MLGWLIANFIDAQMGRDYGERDMPALTTHHDRPYRPSIPRRRKWLPVTVCVSLIVCFVALVAVWGVK